MREAGAGGTGASGASVDASSLSWEWSGPSTRASLHRVNDPFGVALDAMYLALRLALPLLGVAFLVALVVAVLQLFTQLREPVLNAVPRLVGVTLVLALSFGAMSSELRDFATRLYRALPALIAGL